VLGDIGPLEIGIVLIIALLVFGPKKLPELGNGLGRGMREFKETVTGEKRDEVEVKSVTAAETVEEPAVTTSSTGAPSA
jgi:sec-independent protein translocase protein TatA